ncbi:hypothetical protein [Bradyrhizobium sp. 21]|uniref:hypothetical protein n=1 Tax=Bradyrhizobium sp. 21 TaxID=2782666 RepID=UPI001FFA80A5|nr:hypothetical protein [Bradyrhizobium sp. 21]MCK1387347.1 hypothetical protein [Bradyrhizobium sp. 21]
MIETCYRARNLLIGKTADPDLHSSHIGLRDKVFWPPKQLHTAIQGQGKSGGLVEAQTPEFAHWNDQVALNVTIVKFACAVGANHRTHLLFLIYPNIEN